MLPIVAVTVTACQSSDAGRQREAETAVARTFAYPATAEFRNVRTAADGSTICGEVRAKETTLHLSPYKRFAWSATLGLELEEQTDSARVAQAVDAAIVASCGPPA